MESQCNNRLLGYGQSTLSSLGSSTATISYTYNAAGDITSQGSKTFSFNAEQRLSSMATGATGTSPTTYYTHNALGQRVFKTEPITGTPTTGDPGFAFVYYEDSNLLGEYGTGGPSSTGSTEYIWLPTPNGPMPIAAVINGVLFAVHADNLNTPRRLSSTSTVAVWQWKYSAFGDEQPTIAAKRFADLNVNPNPGTTTVASVTFNLRYPGQYADNESGLNYNYFRSYDPGTGRYPQADPIGWAGGPNPFDYAKQNPLKFSDPYGLFVPLIIPGICAAGGCEAAGLALAAGAAWWANHNNVYIKPPDYARDKEGPKAPGQPGEAEGFKDPKRGENWVPNPNGPGWGWEGKDGGVWCPTGPAGSPGSGTSGPAHGGPHWDVQYPGGGGFNMYPGGRRRDR